MVATRAYRYKYKGWDKFKRLAEYSRLKTEWLANNEFEQSAFETYRQQMAKELRVMK